MRINMGTVAGALGAVALSASTAMAQPVGSTSFNGTLDATQIIFGQIAVDFLPAGPPSGAITVASGGGANTGSFTGLDGTAGVILDFIPNPGPLAIDNFITYTAGGFVFDLRNVFAGSFPQSTCTAPGLTICTPTGSSLNLTNNPGGQSTAAISFSGFARTTAMAPGTGNPFIGIFTTQFNVPFQQVVGQIAVDALRGQGFSASITVTPAVTTPEPASIALMGTGLLALGGVAARRRKA